MGANRVKRTLASGGSIGAMNFQFNTTGSSRIAAAAGADFVLGLLVQRHFVRGLSLGAVRG